MENPSKERYPGTFHKANRPELDPLAMRTATADSPGWVQTHLAKKHNRKIKTGDDSPKEAIART